MAEPRFLFVAGPTPARQVWLHRPAGPNPISGSGDFRPDEHDHWMAWRLTGANNRELGRSARVFADLASCRDSVVQLQQDIGRAEPLTIVDDATGLWWWRLDVDRRTVAVAGRLYRRQRESHYNLTQFLATVPVARIAGHTVFLTRDHRRRSGDDDGTGSAGEGTDSRGYRAVTRTA